jgi:putative ABC transport system substrate-binding protein
MKRREFITLLGGAAATWPLEARAQQQAMPMIGFLSSASPGGYQNLLIAFRKGLAELGFSEGRNIIVEYRWAEGRFDRLPALAADLVQRDAAVIVTTGIGSALAAKAASATTSLVFLAGDDPVKFGLVASLSRPGGTATGVAWLTSELFTKRLGLVRELVPATALIGVLINPQSPEAPPQLKEIETAAQVIGQPLHVADASSETDFDGVFAALGERRADALIVSNDPFFNSARERFVALAARHRIRRSTTDANTRSPAVSYPMGPPTRPHIASLASTPARSSRELKQPICRSSRRLSSNWSSTSRLRRHWGSKFRRRCSPAPTR